MSTRSPRTPRLSVITPVYNCLSYTKAMLASLQATIPWYVSYEVILVDDGSTDGTREWLLGLGEPFRVVLNERNIGFGASTNRGAALARGRTLALLNNDLVLRRGWLGPMMRALGSVARRTGVVGNVQVDAATGEVDHRGIVVDVKCKPGHDRRKPSLAALLFRPTPGVFAVTGACLLVRTCLWRRLGGFDERYFNGCEDIDLCLRAREAGFGVVVALRSRVLHHVSSSPGRKRRDEENSMRLFTRWRDKLSEEASREWTRERFCEILPEPRDFPDNTEALKTALYLLRLRRLPPADAVAAKHVAIEHEMERWRKMFSH